MMRESPTEGLLKIEAGGRPITSDADGTETRSKYGHFLDALSAKYGTPSKSYDFLEGGSIWTDPVDFQMSLVKSARKLLSYWFIPANNQEITAIKLEAEGSDQDSGYVTVGYELRGFEKYEDRKDGKADSSL